MCFHTLLVQRTNANNCNKAAVWNNWPIAAGLKQFRDIWPFCTGWERGGKAKGQTWLPRWPFPPGLQGSGACQLYNLHLSSSHCIAQQLALAEVEYEWWDFSAKWAVELWEDSAVQSFVGRAVQFWAIKVVEVVLLLHPPRTTPGKSPI